jgi:hypothetical protein
MRSSAVAVKGEIRAAGGSRMQVRVPRSSVTSYYIRHTLARSLFVILFVYGKNLDWFSARTLDHTSRCRDSPKHAPKFTLTSKICSCTAIGRFVIHRSRRISPTRGHADTHTIVFESVSRLRSQSLSPTTGPTTPRALSPPRRSARCRAVRSGSSERSRCAAAP